MRTSAIILALSWLTPNVDSLFGFVMEDGKTVLETVVENCAKSGVIDNMCILTDIPVLYDQKRYAGHIVHRCPDSTKGHPFNFLNLEPHTLYREFDLGCELDLQGDLMFQVSWNMPFLNSRNLERMYHTLLDNQTTARLIPMQSEDPHLYFSMPESETYIPVWEQKGLDRQLSPQLFRPRTATLTHWDRLLGSIPVIRGLRLDRISCFALEAPDQLGMLKYLQAYRTRTANAG